MSTDTFICAWLILFLGGILIWERRNHRREMKRLQTELEARPPVPTPAPRAVSIPNGWATQLSEKQFIETWLAVDEREPLYLAVQQLLARETLEAIEAAGSPDLADKPGIQAREIATMDTLVQLAHKLQSARLDPHPWTSGQKKTQRRGGAEG